MIDKPSAPCNQSRRATLKAASLALCTTMLPLGGLAHANTPAPRYRRYNASGPHGARMLKSYAKAVRAMLALPPEDPRNWYRQAIIHTLDCPHGNWWFLPWHRAYLGWFEQICRELSGDPQFACRTGTGPRSRGSRMACSTTCSIPTTRPTRRPPAISSAP